MSEFIRFKNLLCDFTFFFLFVKKNWDLRFILTVHLIVPQRGCE